MPIRFFCEHCRQMLKIGTAKAGSVVDCPRCQKAVVVPPQSAPKAEQLYQMLKNKQFASTSALSLEKSPPFEQNTVSEPAVPESLQDELGGSIDDSDLNRWDSDLTQWVNDHVPSPAEKTQTYSHEQVQTLFPLPSVPDEKVALLALQKRYRLTVTLLYVSSSIAFFFGIVFGFYLYAFVTPTHFVRHAAGNAAEPNEVTGTLYFLNKNGERQPDVDAVVICLPKDRQPSPLLSWQGLLPGDNGNNDTETNIHEMGGWYGKTDANGTFTFQHQEGIRYFVVMISSCQQSSGGGVKQSVRQDLSRYFRDSELPDKYCVSTDEYDWSRGKHSFRYIFEDTSNQMISPVELRTQ